jgi:dsDNA-specific endonuclease/ATPase MutS2
MCFKTISLTNLHTVRRIVLLMEREGELRRDTFREVARHPRLQQALLALLAKSTRTEQRRFVVELTKNPRLRRKILKAASRETS